MLWLILPVFARAEIGPAFTGLAGRANDATSVFFSPAGITRLDKPQLAVQAIVSFSEAKFDVDAASIDGGDADNDEKILIIPGAYYVHPLGERWRMGLSLNVPSGIGHDYGKKWAGRYHAEESSLAFVAASAVLAYKLTQKWSVAAGPYVVYTDSKTKARIRNLLPEYGDGSVRLEENGADLGVSLGAMIEFTDTTRLAVSYRSSTDPKLEGTPSFSNLDPLLREALAAADLLGTEVDVDFKVPAQAQAGFYTEFSDRWSMTVDAIWINMSEFGITRVSIAQDDIALREDDFRDMWITSAGLQYRYRDDRSVSIGGLYGTSAISDGDRGIGLPYDRIFGMGIGIRRPCWGHYCTVNLNYFDLGDADLAVAGAPFTGEFEGAFGKNWAFMLDFQFSMRWH